MIANEPSGDDAATLHHDDRGSASTPGAPIETVRALIVALQADRSVTKPEEVARLTYMLQHLVARYTRQAPMQCTRYPTMGVSMEPDA